MAEFKRLRTRADRLKRAEAEQLRQAVLEFALRHQMPERAVGEIVATIDRETAANNGWTFVMISAEANNAVVEWLFAHSSRPTVAVRLWLKLFIHLRHDTGEIVATRDELAAAVGIAPRHVSEVMTELEGIGAISRQRAPHGVRYFMSPRAGTHLTGAARGKAQAAATPLKFDPPKKAKAKPHLAVVPAE
jgi:hypothetical protein